MNLASLLIMDRHHRMRITVTMLFLIAASALQAQELIRGIVVDSASFEPLPGVNIYLRGQLKGTVSDAKGNFSLLASRNDTVVLSLIGYQRLELPLIDYETSMIRLAERPTLLKPITVFDSRMQENPYEGMFDDETILLKKKVPFYYHKARKDKVKAAHWRDQMTVVQTYLDVVVHNPDTKAGLMKKHNLTEKEYYDVLAAFNEKHYRVMYFLTSAELVSLIGKFFEANAPLK